MAATMHRISILILGILCLTGCQSIVGPFAARAPTRVDDPRYSIAEQERRARDRYSLPDQSRGLPAMNDGFPLWGR